MDSLNQVHRVKLSKLIVNPQPKFPPINVYDQLRFDRRGIPEKGPRYIQVNVSDTKQWQSLLRDILLAEKDTGGLTLVIDCAYQLGTPDTENTFLWIMREDVPPGFIEDHVLVWRDFHRLQEVTDRLGRLMDSVPPAMQRLSLDYIIVSNLSIFYWAMRDKDDFSELVELHDVCKQVSEQYDCTVLSSLSYVP